MERETLLSYFREDMKRVEEDLKACSRDIAYLKSRYEMSNVFIDRLVRTASLLMLIGNLVVELWKIAH